MNEDNATQMQGEIDALRAENERLRALLKAASYHVESEGDSSLLTDINRALGAKSVRNEKRGEIPNENKEG